MKVREPTVGPILGATGPDSTRIFLRGEVELTETGSNRPRRCHGVVQLRPRTGSDRWTTQYFKLNPNFDMTGVTVFEDLKASTLYHYRAGWVMSDVDSDDIDVTEVLDWTDRPIVEFRTGSSSPTSERSFVVGSCRYLLRLFGGAWFDDRGDKTFRSVLEQIDEKRVRTDHLLMVGDQIYADDLNFFWPDRTIDDFNQRYREAFSQKHIAALMSRVPTYMTLDDHEIEDNWPEKASERDLIKKFPPAIHSYLTYQLSHSPLFASHNRRLKGTPDKLWYTFRDGCAEFFVMDTRTERKHAPHRQIVAREQMDALKDWLADGSRRVKLIASAVPLFAATSDDKWEGYIGQRDEILEHILDNNVKRTVFLSGDVHASFSCELATDASRQFKVVSVVSSAFFWPYPHPARSDFQLSGSLQSNSGHNYTIRNASKVHANDNFTRVTVEPTGLRVEFYERKGDRLGRKRHRF